MPSAPKDKKILVTGGLGFIGSTFVELMLERGFEIINIDKRTYAARGDVTFLKHPKHTLIVQDICDIKKIPDNISFIVNFAAESHVDNSISSSKAFFNSNVGGVYNILELLRKMPEADRPMLIHISTDEVYGDIEKGSFKETDLLNPSSPYSATKAAADELVFGWGRTYNIKYRICRSSNNYGFGQYAEKLIPRTIKTTGKGVPMTLHGDGSYVREWTHVRDNCLAILLIMEKGADNEIYNISSNEARSNLDVVKTILKAMGKPDNFYTFVENRKGQDIRYSVDSTKLRVLGWSPSTTLEKYIPEYLKLCEERSETLKPGIRTKIRGLIQRRSQ